VPREAIFAATGLQFMELNSLYQLLALQRADSSLLAAADRLLMIPDLFHWLLTGLPSNERTNASTSQCFDPQAGDWAFAMLERFGLPRRIFGPISEPGVALGPLRGDVAAVPADEPPSQRPDWCYVSLGTWALIGAELDRPLVTPECLAHNFTNEAGIGGTTRLLKNVCGLWLVQQCRAAWQRAGQEWTWEQLTALAAEAPPLQTLVDPNHPSLVAPADMPTAIRELARTTGEPVPETLIGRRVGRVHVVGGGVQNRLLCQMIADATGRPVVAGPVEATAIGNLLVQLLAGDGQVDLRAIRGVVRDSFEPVRYEPRDAARWNDRLD